MQKTEFIPGLYKLKVALSQYKIDVYKIENDFFFTLK